MIPKYYKTCPDYYILNLVQGRLGQVSLGFVGLKGVRKISPESPWNNCRRQLFQGGSGRHSIGQVRLRLGLGLGLGLKLGLGLGLGLGIGLGLGLDLAIQTRLGQVRSDQVISIFSRLQYSGQVLQYSGQLFGCSTQGTFCSTHSYKPSQQSMRLRDV